MKGINMKITIAGIAVIVAVAAAAVLFAAHPRTDTKATAAPNTVQIDNFSFTPPTLTVHPGTTVTWVNKDDVPHTVTSTDKKFQSRALDTDERFSFTFPAAGTYDYFCSVHPHMTGKVIVQ
jgi:amicyanin